MCGMEEAQYAVVKGTAGGLHEVHLLGVVLVALLDLLRLGLDGLHLGGGPQLGVVQGEQDGLHAEGEQGDGHPERPRHVGLLQHLVANRPPPRPGPGEGVTLKRLPPPPWARWARGGCAHQWALTGTANSATIWKELLGKCSDAMLRNIWTTGSVQAPTLDLQETGPAPQGLLALPFFF